MKTLFSVGASYDYVIIDGAAKLEDMIAAGIKAADFVWRANLSRCLVGHYLQ
jgi:chromosome partitioning protein